MTALSSKAFGPDEEQALRVLLSLYESGDRYRPGMDPPRFGLQYLLQVRIGTESDTYWKQCTRWYDTYTAAAAVLADAVQHIGWLGQQLRQGTARQLRLVQRQARQVL